MLLSNPPTHTLNCDGSGVAVYGEDGEAVGVAVREGVLVGVGFLV